MARSFLLRARKAPANAARLLSGVGRKPHVEHLAEILREALFLAQDHRRDLRFYLLLEAGEQPVTLLFDTNRLGSLGSLTEAGLLGCLGELLADRERRRGKGADAPQPAPGATELARRFDHLHPATGVETAIAGFDFLVRELTRQQPCYLLHPKGRPIQETQFAPAPCFLLTDQLPMPKKSLQYLKRLGATPLSLGKRMLRASQAVTLVHHYCDLQGV